jgi:hypothetical protein
VCALDRSGYATNIHALADDKDNKLMSSEGLEATEQELDELDDEEATFA